MFAIQQPKWREIDVLFFDEKKEVTVLEYAIRIKIPSKQ